MRRRWKLLLIFFLACTIATLAAWAILLSTICSNPRTPMPETLHDVAYHCHGMTVYISHLEEAMLHWLIPVMGLFILLSMLAAAMIVLSAVHARIDIRINRADASSRSRHREGEHD